MIQRFIFSIILMFPIMIFVMIDAQFSVRTIAGAGSAGDGGPASSADLNYPAGVWSDTNGNVYIAEVSGNRVRKINTAGIISTIAGNGGSASNVGSGGVAATTVTLDQAWGVYGDSAGSYLYIGGYNYFVWRLDLSNGIITRIAGAAPGLKSFSGDGGPATSAKLNFIRGIFLDTMGILYVADQSNNRIRMIDTSTNIITTFAGGGPNNNGDGGPANLGVLNLPACLWGDTEGVMSIADRGNNRIRQVDESGILSTFAGTGVTTYNGDGLAATSTNLNQPYDVKGDTLGNIYIAESGGCRIRVVSAGIITTLAGTGTCTSGTTSVQLASTFTLNSNYAIWPDTKGNLYATEFTSGYVRYLYSTAPTALPTARPTGPSALPTVRPSRTPTVIPTATPSVSPSQAPSRTPSFTPSRKPTATPSTSPSFVPSLNPTALPTLDPTTLSTLDPTFLLTDVPTVTPTTMPSTNPTANPSFVPTVSPSYSPSSPPSVFPTVPPSLCPSVNPTACPTASPSLLPSCFPSTVPTCSPTYTPSCVPSAYPSVIPTAFPTIIPTKTPTFNPSLTPSLMPTASPTMYPSRVPSAMPSFSPSVSPTSIPTISPSIIPSVSPSLSPTATPSLLPSIRPSSVPTQSPTTQPTVTPSTIQPTVLPTQAPSASPSRCPTLTPSAAPTACPSLNPTGSPTRCPTLIPSECPSMEPTVVPTVSPSLIPSSLPTVLPSQSPSSCPTLLPSPNPSMSPSATPPTLAPSYGPTFVPSPGLLPTFDPSSLTTESPTIQPTASSNTIQPTVFPTQAPSTSPSRCPSAIPSCCPTLTPSAAPTACPSLNPTGNPTSLPSWMLTAAPSMSPTAIASDMPTAAPSMSPTAIASDMPTAAPSMSPTAIASDMPTAASSVPPSFIPSSSPTILPSPTPSPHPSLSPSGTPTVISSQLATIGPTQCHSSLSFAPTFSPSTAGFRFSSSSNLSSWKDTVFVFGFFSTSADSMKLLEVSPAVEGTSWIVFGSESLSSLKGIDLSASHYPVTQFAPSYKRDTTSRAALVPGDLNNDGSNDLVACYPMSSSCYIFFGNQADGLRNVMIGTTIYGRSSSSSPSVPAATFFGFAVAGVGDMNEDGYVDIVISALTGTACYVLYGRPVWPSEIRISMMTLGGKISEGADGYKIIANSAAVLTGLSVAGVGDMNGDGKSDLAVSVLGGVSYVVYVIWGEGSEGGSDVFLADVGNGVKGFKVIGEQGYYTGLSISGVGDANKDGVSDLVIGSIPYSDKAKSQQEKSYVVFGSSSSSSSSFADVVLGGMVEGNNVLTVTGGGFIVSGPGDVNGDGIEDIMITDVSEYLGKGNSYIISYPVGLNSTPSFAPSSWPSTAPSNRPSSEPSSSRPTNLPSSTPPSNLPTEFFNISSFNGSAPSFRPSNKPLTRPTRTPSHRPTKQPRSTSPVPNPTFLPTRSPSFRPSFVVPQSPSFRPSKPPQTMTMKPSLSTPSPSVTDNGPVFSPSPPLSEYVVRSVNSSSLEGKGAVFGEPGENEVFQISSMSADGKRSGWSGKIVGGGGRKVYVIYPKDPTQPTNQIVIKDFNSNTDIIDLSRISQISSEGDLSYMMNPLIILLPDHQKIVLSSHRTLSELSESNFMFSSSAAMSGSSSSTLFTSDFILSLCSVAPLVLYFIYRNFLALERLKKPKTDENEEERIMKEKVKQSNPLIAKLEDTAPQINRLDMNNNNNNNSNNDNHVRVKKDDSPEKIGDHNDLIENSSSHASSSLLDDLSDLENQSLGSELEFNGHLSLSSLSIDSWRLADMFELLEEDDENEMID